ncbi:stage II sporulation protein M [Sulfurisphaera ohwakuensis]|uniref:Putative membrane protein SpoIIM required for sporulation n=1 Tax=Sulfurisphaera ohwakuensis TaxID=69656 RepID=A0A650CFG9_SULOH|nr:stage II sporulation protein M [Sulfurisphaera ohwakuensis]MBB5255136.1 putative membrane protein SpoIIM required for sporulation [Sulfurisphaera ohwakuensis]QGR16611.1 hypothetical protein D1869_04935 [Sulfurisphaera ohwakuensis]
MDKEILKLYLTFWSGLLSGWVINNFTGFDKPVLVHELPIPDYALLTHIIEENFIFALILFLIGNGTAQKIVAFAISAFYGQIVFKFGLIVGLVGTIPHGLIELLGFSFIAYAGQKFKAKTSFVKPLLIGYIMLAVAALIESTLSIYIFQHVV